MALTAADGDADAHVGGLCRAALALGQGTLDLARLLCQFLALQRKRGRTQRLHAAVAVVAHALHRAEHGCGGQVTPALKIQSENTASARKAR